MSTALIQLYLLQLCDLSASVSPYFIRFLWELCESFLLWNKKRCFGDFPGGPVVKNPPSNAGDAGLIPGRGTKVPRATGQLSPRAATTEPTCHN